MRLKSPLRPQGSLKRTGARALSPVGTPENSLRISMVGHSSQLALERSEESHVASMEPPLRLHTFRLSGNVRFFTAFRMTAGECVRFSALLPDPPSQSPPCAWNNPGKRGDFFTGPGGSIATRWCKSWSAGAMLQPSSSEAMLRTASSGNVCVDYEAWLRREKAQAWLAHSKTRRFHSYVVRPFRPYADPL